MIDDPPALAPACPAADARKSARLAAAAANHSATTIDAFAAGRAALRDPEGRQAGLKAELVERFGQADRAPILYLSGEAHRRQRAAVARFFTPRVVATRYRALIERESARLVAGLIAGREGDVDELALALAVTIAAEIVGLTDSDTAAMTRRLDGFFTISGFSTRRDRLSLLASFARSQWRLWRFHRADVRPAITARRRAPRDDVISHLIAEGYNPRQIMIECVTYAAAGMVTTREFVTMAAWHLLEDTDLRARFLGEDEAGRLAILEEILRLEPVVGLLHRRLPDQPGIVAVDVRATNADADAVGRCPLAIDPHRARADRVPATGLSFGDGAHRCPGAEVAMQEAVVFLDRLLHVPGLRLVQAPTMIWNPLVTGYELRGCRVACGTAVGSG